MLFCKAMLWLLSSCRGDPPMQKHMNYQPSPQDLVLLKQLLLLDSFFGFASFQSRQANAPFLNHEKPSSTPALLSWLCWHNPLDGKPTFHLPPRCRSFSYIAAHTPAPHSKSRKASSGRWFPKKYCTRLRRQRSD